VKLAKGSKRRALSQAELQAIIEAARMSATSFRKLTGMDRAMLYLTAMTTGFRASELASLTPSQFDLEAPQPVVWIRARNTKNKKPAAQPIPPDAAAVLRGYLAGREPTKTAWPGKWASHNKAAEMLKIDLEAAGIPYAVEGQDGTLYADFHALRHSYITLLAKSKVHPKLAQELARHSSIELTMNIYTHVEQDEKAAAVNSLPSLWQPSALTAP
jgi:integrase